ncbi:hypothetical protein OWV82_021591 [Melia azedarach]|uniref:Uncharacterized protein n=1 Tax=Melia azedarach TaxID=155640 RepID=A0ACC1X055_MELAZ|nr:hypothetical protein OWV82_021591 [Melia azedarach]
MNSSLLNQLLSPILSTPASNRTCNNISSNGDDGVASSCFQRTICLYDWWLVKAEKDYEGKRLAVAGYTSREQQAMRVFTSAPIVKRYDVFTLETADGIYVVIKGFINKSHTMENGFPSEVFSHFMFGFPPHWEAYEEKCFGKEFITGTALFRDYDKSAADPESDAGMGNSISNAIPRNHNEVNGKSKHNARDIDKCSEYVSENTSTNVSKSSDSPCPVADNYDIGNAKNHVSKHLPQSLDCDINNVRSQEDKLAVPAIPSNNHMTKSSERMANSKSRTNGTIGTVTKSKTKERASSEDINTRDAASEESPIPKVSDVDNANPFNLDPDVSLGNSEVALRINKLSNSPGHAAEHYDIGITGNHVSKNLPPSISCDINNVSSQEDNLAVLAVPSSYHMTETSERMANSKSRTKGNTGSATKSKPEEGASSKDITMMNAASGESPVPQGSDVDNVNQSNLNPAVSVGNSEVGLKITSRERKTNVPNMVLNINKSSDSSGHAADHNDIGNTKNHASKNLPALLSCDINNFSSLEDNLEVPAEPSRYDVMTGSAERMADAKSWTKGNAGNVSMRNVSPVESPVPTGSHADNDDPCNLEPAVSLESSDVALRITSSGSKTSQKQKENDKSIYALNYENKNSPNAFVPQATDAIVRSIGEELIGVEGSNLLNVSVTVTHKKSLFTSVVGEPNGPECMENCDNHTLFVSSVHSPVNVNTITPSPVDTNAVNATGSNSGNKSSNFFRSLNSNQKRHSGFSDSAKRGGKILMSEAFSPEDNLKRCSSHIAIHSGQKMDKIESTESQFMGRIFRKLLENFEGKENTTVSTVCGLKAKGRESGFMSVLPDETSDTVRNDNRAEPQEPSHITSVKVNSKQGQGHKRNSQARASRQKKNNLAKCPSGLDSVNHTCNSKTTVSKRERNVKVHSPREKARRKINFDAHASPLTPKTKEKSSVVSPESLSLKRSRSGRLLVPSLDFWRNQIAVYDADRKITGIQEGLEILKPSKGTKSEPPKRKKQKQRA